MNIRHGADDSRVGALKRRSTTYSLVVTIVVTAVFFSNLAVYGAIFVWPLQPVHWLMLMTIAMVPMLLGADGLTVRLSSPLVTWCLGYLVLCLVWYVLFGGGDLGPLALRLLSVLFIIATFALYTGSAQALLVARYALLVCVVFGVVVNVYDFTHPFALVPANSAYANLGRAAGLYINANQSAAALLLGLLLTIDLCRKSLRPYYLLAVYFAILLTVSRGGIVGAGLVTVFLVLSRRLEVNQTLKAILVAGIVGGVAWRFFGPTIGLLDVDWSIVADRLNWLSSLGSEADTSQRVRLVLAQKALTLVADNPFLGSGLGSTELWNELDTVHNMYLAAMADFGFFGILVYPTLAVASVGGLSRCLEPRNLAFVAFVLWWGMVSNNVIGEFYFMMALSLMAAQSEEERFFLASTSDKRRPSRRLDASIAGFTLNARNRL